MRPCLLLFAVVAASFACLSPSIARADEPMRSEEARLADVKLDVGLGVQGYADQGDVPSGASVEPYLRFHFGFADPDHSMRKGLALYDDFWFDFGGIGARDAGGFGEVGAGISLLPGFRTDFFGLFFGPSVRAQAWMGGGKKETHAFSSTSLPLEARLEIFDDPSAPRPRVIVTAWYAPAPYQHRLFGGRLDVLLDEKDPMWLFGSIERIDGIVYDRPEPGADWLSAHGPSWDVRLGLSVGF